MLRIPTLDGYDLVFGDFTDAFYSRFSVGTSGGLEGGSYIELGAYISDYNVTDFWSLYNNGIREIHFDPIRTAKIELSGSSPRSLSLVFYKNNQRVGAFSLCYEFHPRYQVSNHSWIAVKSYTDFPLAWRDIGVLNNPGTTLNYGEGLTWGFNWSRITGNESLWSSYWDDYILGYSVQFVTNGGTPVESLANLRNLPDPLPTTTRDGFAFTGWYTDSSLIFPAIPGAEISEDTTLYAGWRPNQFTVTFEVNGGEPVGQLTNVNQLPDPLPITLKVGNDFAGWFTDSEFFNPAVPGAFISQNTTLYAKWVEQQSTDIHVPTVSTPSLLQTGFVTMWQPTLDEVRELANFLWTTNLFDNLRKLFNDPMEAILFLGIIPFDVSTAERGNIYFGNLDTDVESTPIVQQYYTLDFGDIDMTEYYHSFLDYEPSTTVEIFLPFCGTHKLSANEVMGSVMNLKYNVDVFTGTCVAMLTVTKPGIDSVMYSFEGNLMSTIPVTAKNYSDFIRSAVSAVASAIALGAII